VVEIVLLLLFVLAIVMLVGHGLWLLVSAVVRALGGGGRKPAPAAAREQCAGCGMKLAPGQDRCWWCGLGQASSEAAELADLKGMARQLRRFHEQGLLDITALERLQGQVEARRRVLMQQALLGPQATPAAQPARPEPATVARPAAGATAPASERVEKLRPHTLVPRPPARPPRTPAPVSPAPAPEPSAFAELLPASPPPPPSAAPVERPRPRDERPAAAPVAPRPPRRSFAELLAAFMEQRNILWGEVVGGLLIVGCSIALVISLWQTLEENPLYQAAIFVSVTAGLFGAGLYTLSHWKLESTSRGLLVIATLLVPLNLLAMTTGRVQGGDGLLALAMELVALLIFGGLLSLAGKVLVPEGRWRFAGTVLAVAAWQLLVVRLLAAPAAAAAFLLLGLVPVVGHCLSTGSVLATTTRRGSLQPRQASALYGLLGMTTFALGVTLGQLIFRRVDLGGRLAEALAAGAPLIALAGWPLVVGGILIRQGLPDGRPVEGATEAGQAGGLRTAGTATTLLGILILTAAVVLAWPQPVPVLVVCALNVVVLAYVAFRHALPAAHAAVIVSLTLGYLAAFDLLTGELGTAGVLGPDLAVTAASGRALVGLALGMALIAEGLSWSRFAGHGVLYAAGAGAVAVLSLFGVTFPSEGAWALREPVPAVIVYAVYGAASLAVNLRQRRPILTSLGLALLAAATLWALWAAWPQQVPRWGAVLAGEALVMCLLAVALGHPIRDLRSHPGAAESVTPTRSLAAAFAEPLARSAEAVALLALAAGVWGGIAILACSAEAVITGVCLTGLFVLLAVREQRRLQASLAGCLLTVTAVVFAAWAGTVGGAAPLTPWLAVAAAAAATLMAAVAVGIGRPRPGDSEAPAEAARWSLAILGSAWLKTAAVASVLALVLVGLSLPAGPSPLHTYSGGLLTVTALLLAWGYQSVALSWLGAALALAGITHAFYRATDLDFPAHLLDYALLTHATALLLAGLGLRLAFSGREQVARLYTDPFRLAGLISSFAALPFLLWPNQEPPALPTLGLFWLSVVWLTVGWLRRWPELFTAFQAVLTLAVLFAGLTWLARQDWFIAYGSGDLARFWDPRSWHAYGLGLALLSLGWVAVRIAGRAHPTAQALLEPGWPGVDRLVLIGLVLGQTVLAVLAVAPALALELFGPPAVDGASAWPAAVRGYALNAGAWLLLGLLAATLLVALWERWAAAAMLGLVFVAFTVPVLWAGALEGRQATGVALRWGLGGELLVLAAAMWGRRGLQELSARFGWPIIAPFNLTRAGRALLDVFLAAPVILLTILTAMAHWGEEFPLGSRYWLLAAGGPLLWVCLAWVGHALRERSAGYAFAAGLVANFAVTGGYALAFVHSHLPLERVPWDQLDPQLVELAALTAALWAVGWTAVRSRLLAPASPTAPAPAPWLLHVQTGMAGIGAAWLIGAALLLLLALHPQAPTWTRETGSVLGWLTLAAATAALGYARTIPDRLLPRAAGLVGFTAAGFLACSVERIWPGRGWGYRALMLGWAAYPLTWVAGLGVQQFGLRKPDSPAGQDAAVFWAHLSGVLAVFLALGAAFGHGEPAWAAAAVALVSPAWMALAVARRREEEVFAAGLGVNLAASLVVWHFHPAAFWEWRILLVQANAIAGALVALLWLGLRQPLYRKTELTPTAAPMLATQLLLVLIGNAILLVEPLALLVLSPGESFPVHNLGAGQLLGWLALTLALMAAAAYALQVAPPTLVHVFCGFGLAFGVLNASVLARSAGSNWSAFHALLAAWTAAGPVALALGWAADIILIRLIYPLAHGEASDKVDLRTRPPVGGLTPSLQAWVRAMGVAAVLLALRGASAGDPGHPYWPAGASLAVSLTFGVVALWSNRAADVYASGLLLNLVGTLLWGAWGPGTLGSFAATQALCLAIGSGAWSAFWFGFGRGVYSRAWPPYPHFAAILALGVLGTLFVAAVATSVSGQPEWAAGPLTWAAVGGTAVALVLLLWDPAAPFSPAGLYALALVAVGLALHARDLGPRTFGWTAALVLAFLVLVAANIAWTARRLPGLRQALRLPDFAGGRPQPWYVPAQGTVAGLVLILSVWMSLDFALVTQRLAGPLALATLLPAGFLMAAGARPQAALLPTATLLLGVALVVEAGWAFLDPGGHAPAWLWLHRSVMAMFALALMTSLYGLAPRRWLPHTSGWAASCRRLGPVLGIAAALLVPIILVQEAALFEGHKAITTLVSRMLRMPPPPALDAGAAATGTPMAPLAIGVVAVALLVLITAAIRFAVRPGADPLGLSERGRTLYIYGAEILLVLVLVHFRLTVPELFRQGFFLRYWPFVIMAVAFSGVALAEFLSRQGLRVVAEPLERTGVFLPLLPVMAYWVLPGDRYALLWFTAGLVYAFLFVTRRSFRFGLIAALAANVGLWVLLYHHEWHFYVHPQVWLIPLALIALVSEHVNRDRLTPYQSAGLRYLALLVLYLSSTADLFIAGLGRSLVLTLVLAVLSVLGVLAGMLLRVRAFLFLGVTFLLLDVLTIIWHAGVDRHQTWVLWLSGIVLGAAILTLFGIFEKRRNDVLRLVEELRRWD
jgi:hypothetical protein